jgi:2,3-bisphosphoglycerate-independent phosphoglycerate mutase
MLPRKHLLMVFVDGLGWGEADPARNPLAAICSRIFPRVRPSASPVETVYGGWAVAADACLGVSGLPQSATGQAALLTGVNAAALLGYHLSGFPNQQLKALLERESIFVRLQNRGYRCAFANAYPPSFFTQTPRRISVTTAACQSADIRLKTLEDLMAGEAVYQDFTHRYLRERGCKISELSPAQAGRHLAQISRRQDFTLYEHFLTDFAGHSGDVDWALRVAEELEMFLTAVLEKLDLRTESLLVASDHGNLEDMSIASHTLNPVYVISWGPVKEYVASSAASIAAVVPGVLHYLEPI